MKCRRLLFIVAAGLVVACMSAQAREVVIASGEYPPWSGEKLPYHGLVNRVVVEAFRREGIAVRLKFFPWRRALEMLRTGAADASSFWFEDDAKAKLFLYSDPISEHRELLFHRKDTILPAWSRLEDLANFRFCATHSYAYTSSFWLLVGNGTLRADESPDDDTCLRKLLAGRVDIFPMDESAGWLKLSGNGFPAGSAALLTTDEVPLRLQSGHLLMRRTVDAGAMMKRFNAGLASMRRDGTVERYRREQGLGGD